MSVGDLTAAAEALDRLATVCFRHGLARNDPALIPSGLRGVGVTDVRGRRTRVVQVGLPDQALRVLQARGSRNPLKALGWRLLKGAVTRASAPREMLFQGGKVLARDPSHEEPWMDISLPDAKVDGPRLIADPLWVADLLLAPEMAIQGIERASDPSSAETALWADIDFAEVAELIPIEARQWAVESGLTIGRLHAAISANGTLRTLAVLPPEIDNRSIWRVVEFGRRTENLEGVDLWHAWTRESQRREAKG